MLVSHVLIEVPHLEEYRTLILLISGIIILTRLCDRKIKVKPRANSETVFFVSERFGSQNLFSLF